MKTENEINKLAAEAMGICTHKKPKQEDSLMFFCKHCGAWAEIQSYDFCNDLNAAQKLFRFAYEAETGMLEMALDVMVQAELKHNGADDVWPNNVDYVLASAKTIALAALVALGLISPEEAKECLG